MNCFHCFYLFIFEFLEIILYDKIAYEYCSLILFIFTHHFYHLLNIKRTFRHHSFTFILCVCVCVQTVDFYYLFGKDLFKNVFQLKDVVHVETTKHLK